MSEVVMLREFGHPLDKEEFYAMARDAMGCLELYRADWQESFMAADGSRLVCRFQAPDSEAIRLLSRGDGATEKSVWSGEVHDAAEGPVNVVVERSFDQTADLEQIQALEDAVAWCLEEYRVQFVRTVFSSDHRRMLCLYRAPDAESVRRTQEQGNLPFDSIWPCLHFTPDNIFG